MPNAFSIARSRISGAADAALRQEIDTHTGSEEETTSILRSIERFGTDASIRRYEMTPKPQRGTGHVRRTVSWIVRAVRLGPDGAGSGASDG